VNKIALGPKISCLFRYLERYIWSGHIAKGYTQTCTTVHIIYYGD